LNVVTQRLANVISRLNTNGYALGTPTNYSGASAYTNNDGGFGAALGSAKSSIEGLSSSSWDEGDPSAVDIPVGTFTMTINPFGGQWADAWAFLKRMAAWVLAATFLIKVSKDTFEFLKVASTAHGIQIPELGILGTNAAGAGVAVGILAAVMIAYAVMLGLAGVFFAAAISGGENPLTIFLSNPGTGASAATTNGFAMIGVAFPLHVMIGLSVAYIAWRLSMSGVAIAFVIAMKALTGS